MLRVIATLAVPTAFWFLGRTLERQRIPLPPFPAHAAVGLLAPPTLLAWARHGLLEEVSAWLLSAIGWAGALLGHDPEVLVASGLAGMTWGFLLGLRALHTDGKPAGENARSLSAPPPQAHPRRRSTQDEAAVCGDMAFRLALRCPTCGAELPVPVYNRMALCGFCNSEHLLVGHGAVTHAVVPDAVTTQETLVAAVVKHFRRIEYIRLFEQRVRPIIENQQRAQEQGEQPSLTVPDNHPLVVAMERQVSSAADAYAAKLASRLVVRGWERFLAPYWHRFGTLYQAAFGRDRDSAKRMELVVTTLEGSAPASSVPLPPMGKLSYLRALNPLHGAPEASVPALPVELGQEEIDRKVQEPTRRSSDLSIQVITHVATFVPEVVALIYRPWHIASIEVDGRSCRLLVDGAGADVAGEPQWVGALEPKALGVTSAAAELQLVPSRCPECGGDLEFAPDTVVHLCRNCFRAVAMEGKKWRALPYYCEAPQPGAWMAPFWRFPVMVRTVTGELITDLAHLADGIDGTLDQIGDTPMRQEHVLVPAFRSRVGKVGVRLYRRIWPLAQPSDALRVQRFDPVSPPRDVLAVTLPADEARVFARVYLALAFGPKDLARADIKRVRARFLEAQIEGVPELAFVNLPAAVIAPNLAAFGRARPGALSALEGTA